jgi:GNAT superfamily N-acetyltransferase
VRADDGSPSASRARVRDLGWIPIRSLTRWQRGRILTHLLHLDAESRFFRFGYPATDEQLRTYAGNLDFHRDELFGIFNQRLEMIAMAHLAHPPGGATTRERPVAEFGVSVLEHARRRGFGRRLFEHAMLHARNRGVNAIFIHALSENAPMLKIARGAGATVHRDGSESEAWLELPPGSFVSRLDEIVGTHAAEIDYGLKARAHHLGHLFGLSTERETP